MSKYSPNHYQRPAGGTVAHKLCLLVPFRDRFEELTDFVPQITDFLESQNVFDTEIFVVNQDDDLRFNRAFLLNIGFIESQKKKSSIEAGDAYKETCDYVALHDVDLVPKNPKIRYEFPAEGPLHLSAPGLHPIERYDYPDFIGGILLITSQHMRYSMMIL